MNAQQGHVQRDVSIYMAPINAHVAKVTGLRMMDTTVQVKLLCDSVS